MRALIGASPSSATMTRNGSPSSGMIAWLDNGWRSRICSLIGSARGCDLKMLITGRPAAARTSTCARSSKRSQVSSLIQRKLRPAVSMTSPNGANAAALSAAALIMRSLTASPSVAIGEAEHPDAAQAAIRMDIDSHMRDRPQLAQLVAEAMHTIGLQKLRLQQQRPRQAQAAQVGLRIRAQQRALDRHLVRVVAFVVGGIDVNALDSAAMAQAQNDPVIARSAPSARLPSVGHVHAAAG